MSAGLVLVTGASSGIGAAVCAALVAEGRPVLGVARRRPAQEEVAWLPGDLADPDPDALRALAREAARLGPVTGVVHAAGLLRPSRLGALDHADAERMWRLHVRAPSILVDALADDLPDGARVVLIGSRTAAGQAGKSGYSASKSALVGLGRSWAQELAPRGITVNVVAPGPTATPMLADPARGAMPPTVPPLGRFVAAEEVAGLVAFLLGPLGGSVTGQHLVVCGGASL